MTGLVKVLIGTAVVAAVGTGVALAVHDSKEKKYVDVAEQAVEKDEDGSVLKKIKRFVKRKFIKALAWIALHMEQIEAVSTVIGLASGIIGIATAIKEYRRGDDVQSQLDNIENKVDSFISTYNHNIEIDNSNNVNLHKGLRGITHNQEIIFNTIKGDVA